ncbi:MAG: ABC transporter ATP-binding protein, partial [Nitrospira sp.]|nr:ABC transporter ATP-binding protein [Nitrospira sp.]
MVSDDVVIRAEGLWKHYGIGAELKRLLSFRRSGRAVPLDKGGSWALRDVNFEVRRGDILGVIGRNGAGKSTLLKVLAGVTLPTHGRVEVRGCVYPMIQLNAGLHTYLTGRQNVHLLGAVMGFSNKEIQDRMSEIEEFCELSDYFDRPVWTYSSGMLARLGFGVAVNVDADILLIDEILAVGDLGFRKKCYDRMETIRKSGATIVLVSHNMRQIQRICDDVIWLERGAIAERGEPEEVTRSFMDQMIRERYADALRGSHRAIWQSSGEMTVLAVRTLDHKDRETTEFVTFEPLKIQVTYEAHEPLRGLILGLSIFTSDMIKVHSFTTELAIPDLSLPPGCGIFACVVPELRLMPGVYFLTVCIK